MSYFNMDKKKYYSCYWLNSGIHFTKDNVRFCCYEYLHSKNDNVIIDKYDGSLIDYEKFFSFKENYVNLAKSGEVHPNCKGCIYLEEKEWDDSNYFDHFLFNHWLNCNSKCIYCEQAFFHPQYRRQYYDVYPILVDMKKNNLLKGNPHSCVVFGGGEPTLLSEFDTLLDLFMQENFNNIRVNSSGIKYSLALENALKEGSASLVISPDSGSKDVYKKIKRVDAFDIVWKNISNYTKNAKNPCSVKAKYILIRDVNDNKREIDNFFKMCVKNGVKAVSMSVEQHWYFKEFPNMPPRVYELISYFEEKGKKLNFDIELYCEAISVLQNRKSVN